MLTGQKITELRMKAGLTQEQLADKLYVTRTMVSKWERDICQPDRNTIVKMADIFSVSPDDIMSVKDAVINELYSFISDADSDDLLKDLPLPVINGDVPETTFASEKVLLEEYASGDISKAEFEDEVKALVRLFLL